jgi:YfiH family protein
LNLGVHVGDALQNVQINRTKLQDLLPSQPVWLHQVHGNRVVDADCECGLPKEGPVEADASVTMKPGTVCVIQTADCLPVLFSDTKGRVVGAAHAGWRGLATGVLENTVARMRAGGAEDIVAWLGPAIGPACFEVGVDVKKAFPEGASAFVPLADQKDKYLADIYALARMALRKVDVDRVEGGEFCTVSQPQDFFSYRRDGQTGRMATFIWIK